MIKGKDGKWYNRKADMIAAENKANELKVEPIEENMVKKTQPKEKKPKAEKVKAEEIPEQKQPDNSKPYLKRKKMVTDIFKLKEEGKNLDEIASKAGGISPAYVSDVLDKGIEAALQEVRDQYHIIEEPISETPETDVTETNTDPKAPKEKKAKVPKEKKEKKTPLWQIITDLAPEGEFTAAEMIALVEEKAPGIYKDTTVKLHLIGMDTTNPKSEHNFPSLHKHAFLEHIGEGKDVKYKRQ